MFIRFALIAAAVAALASPAAAQDVAQDERPVDLNMGAGFTIPYSGAKDGFGPAGNFQIGVTGNITQEFAIQANYGYNHFASTDISPTATTTGTFVSSISLTAKHTMHDGDVSLVFSGPKKNHDVSPYGLVGAGVYHSIISVTTSSVGSATVCEPLLLVCYTGPVPVNQIIGKRTATDFGINVGGGISVRVEHSALWFFAEFRYIHTYGPSFTDVAGATVHANGNYFPFIFGFRESFQ